MTRIDSTPPGAEWIAHPVPPELAWLDESATADLDMLTRVAALVTGAPNAFVTFADDAHIWSRGAANDRIHAKPREESFCTAALAEDDVLLAPDVRQDERTRAIAARQSGDRAVVAYAGALLKADDGRKLGTLCVTDHVPRELTQEQVDLLRGLARQVMTLISLRRARHELSGALDRMTHLARTDELTGLLNRRAFFDETRSLQALVQRQQGSVSLVLVDIDHFKAVNDRHGHAAGDSVLSEVASRLRNTLRASDRVGRVGGEEFAIALPFTGIEGALTLVEKVRQAVRGAPVKAGSQSLHVSVSAGVAEMGAASIDETLRRADEALYRAKAGGRNLVMAA